ncbi:MAG: NAD-dependent epimerase/dehydratase family protein [Rubrivivax sp.]|nr:MAG: NAD-dependent epimerase/dehydratase family protein [Rubrivivax sp.]
MNILLCGASGFIGAHLAKALQTRGHVLRLGVRDPQRHAAEQPDLDWVQVDFARDTTPDVWTARLRGIDVVINAVGILREEPGQSFEDLHVRGPSALFEACARSGIRRVIQISALGADEQAETAYHLSKKAADDCLLQLPVNGVVLQPSLVYGPQGASTRLFTTLATLPIMALPGGGGQLVQPVHIDDLTEAVVRLVGNHEHAGERIVVAGGTPLSLRDYLGALRQSLGFGRAWSIGIPKGWIDRLMRWNVPGVRQWLDEDTWQMLERGNTGDTRALTALLGRPPRSPPSFIQASEGWALRSDAALTWLLPLLKLSLAVVWLVSGVVSMGLYPVDDSLAMLAKVGVGPPLANWMLYGAAALDMLLGIATLAWPRRRLWLAQIALVLGYTAIISAYLPEQWLHPFAPVVKNLPFLAILCMLYTLEERP